MPRVGGSSTRGKVAANCLLRRRPFPDLEPREKKGIVTRVVGRDVDGGKWGGVWLDPQGGEGYGEGFPVTLDHCDPGPAEGGAKAQNVERNLMATRVRGKEEGVCRREKRKRVGAEVKYGLL